MQQLTIKLNYDTFNNLQRNRTNAQMCELMNLSRTQFWRIKNMEADPGLKFIAGIMYAFPEIQFRDIFYIADL